MEKYGVDVLAIQETKQLGNEIRDLAKYTFCKSGGSNRHGVGSLVKKEVKISVVSQYRTRYTIFDCVENINK